MTADDTLAKDSCHTKGLPLKADGERGQYLAITGYLFLIYDYEVYDKGYK